jgi:hypothetical protein
MYEKLRTINLSEIDFELLKEQKATLLKLIIDPEPVIDGKVIYTLDSILNLLDWFSDANLIHELHNKQVNTTKGNK